MKIDDNFKGLRTPENSQCFNDEQGAGPIMSKENTSDLVKGIVGDKEDIKWRQEEFGTNEYPSKSTKSVMSLIIEQFSDNTLKILIAASILCIVAQYSNENAVNENEDTGNAQYKHGWIQCASIWFTFGVIVTVSSWSTHNCQRNVNKAMDLQLEYSVFRHSNTTTTVPHEELVVGDVYKVQPGMMVPADSILI